MRNWLMVLCAVLAQGCASTTTERLKLPPLQTVAQVDLDRYLGTWYEIANFPQSFQKGCTATTANYALRDDGEIDVVNACRKDSVEGPEKVARGRARVVDTSTNAKLEVSFFRPFWGDYWVIDLGADYEYAVVGHPSRDYLWILARQPTMEHHVYDAIVARLAGMGYETGRLVRTVQSPSSTAPTGPDATGPGGADAMGPGIVEGQAEPTPSAKKPSLLDAAILRAIEKDCHWTTLAPVGIARQDGAVAMMLSFNNEKLPPAAWTPETAVQYVFDGAVQPILKAVYEDPEKRFSDVTWMNLDVRMHPWEPPWQLQFEVPLDLWKRYRDNPSRDAKIELYRTMVIMSEDERFRFDPVKAADVE